jgi:hypothetical protein
MSGCQHGALGGYSHYIDYEGRLFDAQKGLRTGQEYQFPEALIAASAAAVGYSRLRGQLGKTNEHS